MKKISIVFLLVVFIGWTNSNSVPIKLPNINYYTLSGDSITSDSLAGKIVYVNFWASWCNNCRKLNRSQIALYEKIRQQFIRNKSNIVFLSISLDEKPEYWRLAMAQDDMHWPNNISDLAGWKSKYVEAYHVKSIPANFIFNQKGQLIGQNVWGYTLDSTLLALTKSVSN